MSWLCIGPRILVLPMLFEWILPLLRPNALFWVIFHFWAQKCKKWDFCTFWPPGHHFRKIVIFWQKVPFRECTNSHTPSTISSLEPTGPQKCNFAPKSAFCSKNAFFAKKFILCSTKGICAKSALFGPLPANPCFTNAISINFYHLRPNALLGPKCTFGARDAFSVKMHKMLQRGDFGPKTRKRAKVPKKLTSGSAWWTENTGSRIRAQSASSGVGGKTCNVHRSSSLQKWFCAFSGQGRMNGILL